MINKMNVPLSVYNILKHLYEITSEKVSKVRALFYL